MNDRVKNVFIEGLFDPDCIVKGGTKADLFIAKIQDRAHAVAVQIAGYMMTEFTGRKWPRFERRRW
jgi:hypothetical protein